MELARLVRYPPENVILEKPVLFGRGHAARAIFVVKLFGVFAGGISETQAAEIGGFEFDGDTAAFLIVLHCFVDESDISGEIRGQRIDALLLFPARKHFLL